MSWEKSFYKRLAEAKERFPVVEKRGVNLFFKSTAYPKGSPYILYDDIGHKIRPILIKHGIDYAHSTRSEENRFFVGTYLVDLESGNRLEPFEMPLAYDTNPQKQSAGTTYAKRVTLCGRLEIVSEQDDDGNAAAEEKTAAHSTEHTYAPITHAQPEPQRRPAQPAASKQELRPNPAKAGEPISEAQAKRLFALSKSAGWDINEVKDFLSLQYSYSSTKDILRKDYEKICGYIQSNSPQDALKQLGLERAGDDRNAPPPFTDSDLPF